MAKNYSNLPGSIFLAKKNKIEPYNPDTSIYHLKGHSFDQNRNNSNVHSDLDIIDIPTNCTYVTNTLCGDNSQPGLIMTCLFSDNNSLLKDPLNNFNELKTHNSIGTNRVPRTLGVHSLLAASPHMKKYVNTIYTFYQSSKYQTGLFRMGTTRLAAINNDGECESIELQDNINNYLRSPEFKTDTLTIRKEKIIDNFLKLFQDSIYPTVDDIRGILPSTFPSIIQSETRWFKHLEYLEKEFKKIINSNFKVDQATLFKYFPGIFYNLSCRGLSANNTGEYQLSQHSSNRGRKFTKAWLRRNESQSGRNEQARVSPPASNPASLAPSSGTSSPPPGTPGGGYRRKTRKSKRKFCKRTARK